MQVNSVVCRCDELNLLKEGETKHELEYRGNHLRIGKTSLTLFVKRERIREVFFSINLAVDLSCALSEYFRKKITVSPRISNVQASKTLKIARTGDALKEFIRKIDNISKLDEVRVCQEGNVFMRTPLGNLYQNPIWHTNNFVAIQTKSNAGKLTCKFQMNKEKTKYMASFVVTNFGKKTQQINKFLQQK